MLRELSSTYFSDQSLLENEVHLMYLILEGKEEEENTSTMDPQENMDFDSNGSATDEPTVN